MEKKKPSLVEAKPITVPAKRKRTNEPDSEPTAKHPKISGRYTRSQIDCAVENYGEYIADTYFKPRTIDKTPLDFPTFLNALRGDYWAEFGECGEVLDIWVYRDDIVNAEKAIYNKAVIPVSTGQAHQIKGAVDLLLKVHEDIKNTASDQVPINRMMNTLHTFTKEGLKQCVSQLAQYIEKNEHCLAAAEVLQKALEIDGSVKEKYLQRKYLESIKERVERARELGNLSKEE